MALKTFDRSRNMALMTALKMILISKKYLEKVKLKLIGKMRLSTYLLANQDSKKKIKICLKDSLNSFKKTKMNKVITSSKLFNRWKSIMMNTM